MIRRFPIGALALLAGLMAAGCQAPAPQPPLAAGPIEPVDLRMPYEQAAPSQGEVYTLDPAASVVRIYVFRGGKAAKAGHNHILGVSDLEGYVLLDPDRASGSRFDLRVPLDALVIDDPVWRRQTGGTFASPRSESDIDGTRRNLLGPRVTDAARFPYVSLRAQALAGDWPLLVADVAITLKGVTHVQSVLIHAGRDGDRLRVSGEFMLRQSDFGIEPFSVLGGLMSVQDAVGITFELVGRPGLNP